MNRRQFFLLIIICLTLLPSCSKGRYEVFSGYAQGGTYTVKANLKGVKVSHAQIASKIDSLLTGIDFSISGYNKNSILSRRNRGEDAAPDSIFTALLRLSELYSGQTDGAFSVTAAPHTTEQLYSLPLACQSVSANVSVRLFPGVIVTNLSALSATDESVVDPLVFTPI